MGYSCDGPRLLLFDLNVCDFLHVLVPVSLNRGSEAGLTTALVNVRSAILILMMRAGRYECTRGLIWVHYLHGSRIP